MDEPAPIQTEEAAPCPSNPEDPRSCINFCLLQSTSKTGLRNSPGPSHGHCTPHHCCPAQRHLRSKRVPWEASPTLLLYRVTALSPLYVPVIFTRHHLIIIVLFLDPLPTATRSQESETLTVSLSIP